MGQARHDHQKHSTLLTDTKIILATCTQLFHNIRSTRSTPAVVNDCVLSFLSPQMSTSGLSARSTKPPPRLLVCTNFPISDRLWCKWPPGYQSTVCTWTPQVLHLWAYCHLHVRSTTNLCGYDVKVGNITAVMYCCAPFCLARSLSFAIKEV